MSEYSQPPNITDERFVRITKPVEVWDSCISWCAPVDLEQIPPLEALALSSRDDFDPELAQCYCTKHDHYYFAAGQCPEHLYQAQPGDELSLPYHAACALIARREAEGMSLPSLPVRDPVTGRYPEDYWDLATDNLKLYNSKAKLGADDDALTGFYDL